MSRCHDPLTRAESLTLVVEKSCSLLLLGLELTSVVSLTLFAGSCR